MSCNSYFINCYLQQTVVSVKPDKPRAELSRNNQACPGIGCAGLSIPSSIVTIQEMNCELDILMWLEELINF